jgi:protein-disulfide isomerase
LENSIELSKILKVNGVDLITASGGGFTNVSKDRVENSELAKKVDADFESGVVSGVNGTPSFYVNGKKFDGGAEDLFQLLSTNEE